MLKQENLSKQTVAAKRRIAVKESIYDKMIENGIECSNHYSDLYVPVNPVTIEMLKQYEFKEDVRVFTSNIDGKAMFNIPFAYKPYWIEKEHQAFLLEVTRG